MENIVRIINNFFFFEGCTKTCRELSIKMSYEKKTYFENISLHKNGFLTFSEIFMYLEFSFLNYNKIRKSLNEKPSEYPML